MDSRAQKIISMVITKNEDLQTTSTHNSKFNSTSNIVDQEFVSPSLVSNDIQLSTPNNIDSEQDTQSMNDSFDTNSIPDSQLHLDISMSDFESPKRPNFIINESTSAESDSNSDDSSTCSDFDSDDSVKDPDYKINEPKANSDEDIEPPSIDVQPISDETQARNVESHCHETQLHNDVCRSPSIEASPSVVTEPPSVEAPAIDLPRKSRKRKAHPELWKKNITKLLRNSGRAYTSQSKSQKKFEAKKIRPTCTDKCKYKCGVVFSTDERSFVFEEYWRLADLEEQRRFIHSNMTTIEPKYRYTRVGSVSRATMNHAYYLPRDNKRIRVCKVFFMNTLVISDKAIRTVVKKTANLTGAHLKDNRGKHGNSHQKLSLDLTDGVRSHINSIPRIESHYCRAQTQKEYIEGGYTIAALHRDYVEECKSKGMLHVAYQIYYNIFVNEFNISFWCPKKDQCEDCTAYRNAEDKSLFQERYDIHLKEKDLSRSEKEIDKHNVGDNFIVAVYDMQAVMPCPRGEISNFYYVSKLNLYNFTITELGSKNTTCFVWHEGEGGRGANEIGSCVLMYLKSLHDKANEDFDVVFYSDNCCGQQKNKFVLAMYQYAISELPKLKSITHKYLIKGHTQNEGDAIHSMIQRNITRALKSSPIYVPDQYITLIKTAKKTGTPYTVQELTHENFLNLKSLASGNYSTNEDGEKVKWADLKVIKTDKEHQNQFFYKTSYEDTEFAVVTTLKRRQNTNASGSRSLRKLYANKLQIAEAKKQGILKLIEKNVIPKYYESFYATL